MSYAAIHIPEFPTAAWLRLQPGVRTHAVVVIEGVPPLEKVVSVNRAARALGVDYGMSKVQAEAAGQILFHTRSMIEEKAALDRVFEIAERFSPRIQVIASPVNEYAGAKRLAASLLVDQRGTEMLFGPAGSFAEQVRESLLKEGFPNNVAVAPNAAASLLLSQSYAGTICVDERTVKAKLARLPLKALHCEESLLVTFSQWGIRTLGELAELPEAGLVSRVGQCGRRLQRQALGIDDHLLVPQEPAFVLSDRVLLDSALESMESLLFVLSPMLEKLLKQAVHHAYALRSVSVRLELEKLAPHEFVVKPAIPVQRSDLLLQLLNLKLQADPPRAGIVAVGLTADLAIPHVLQQGLFQAQSPEPGKLDLLIAQLKAMVGENNVGSPTLTNSHRDDEFTMSPFQPSIGRRTERPTARSIRPALRRLRPLQPVRVLLRDAKPVCVVWKGKRLEVVESTGPWQSSGYWWDERSWAASEWDAIVSMPIRSMLLRHEAQTGTWFLAGFYD